jgi:hypothetical protein
MSDTSCLKRSEFGLDVARSSSTLLFKFRSEAAGEDSGDEEVSGSEKRRSSCSFDSGSSARP